MRVYLLCVCCVLLLAAVFFLSLFPFFYFSFLYNIYIMQSTDAEQNDTTNLYDTLNLPKSATQDEIKKVTFIAVFFVLA